MTNITRRLAALRSAMAEHHIDAYYVPTEDSHLSEYVCAHFKSREFLSGFTGSAGTLVVLMDEAGLWTDGRYFLQAAEELEGSGITLYKSGLKDTPSIEEFLCAHLTAGSCVAFDGRTMSAEYGLELGNKLSKQSITIHGQLDLISKLWEDRPSLPDSKAWVYDLAYAGQDMDEKVAALREVMDDKGADYHVIAMLDELAWLLNLRGTDVDYNPVIYSFAVIGRTEIRLYVDPGKLPLEVTDYLKGHGVSLWGYEDIYEDLKQISPDSSVLVSPANMNLALYKSLEASGATILSDSNPILHLKAIKNQVEIQQTRKAHLKDGVAMVRFMKWLKEHVGDLTLTEAGAARYLDQLRMDTPGNLGLSFTTISGYAAHGAIIHYSVTEESDIPLEPKGLLLVDSGGQYLEGTTDITRTFALGSLTKEEKLHFAIVLRSMLSLANAVFPEGTTGQGLDMLAREPMWEYGLDFLHGTGHGVGHLLNVHEGPNRFSQKFSEKSKPVAIMPGMITTDEPGLYFPGQHGIRTENELLCREYEKTKYGNFYHFEVLTLAPIDLDAIDPALLTDVDIKRLNDYHKRVYELLAPELTSEEQEWLAQYTRAL